MRVAIILYVKEYFNTPNLWTNTKYTVMRIKNVKRVQMKIYLHNLILIFTKN